MTFIHNILPIDSIEYFHFKKKNDKKKLKKKLIYFILIYFVIQDAHKICKFLFCQNLNSSSEITLLAIVSTPWCSWVGLGTVTSIWYQKFREFTVVEHSSQFGNTGCGVFKRGIQNRKDFCLRFNICTQRKLLNFEFGLMASCQKMPKFDFLFQKSFYALNNTHLGAHFFDKINF